MTTLNDALVNILTGVTSSVQAGISFLSAQIPDVVVQLLHWKIYQYSLQIFSILFLFIALGIWIRYLIKQSGKWEDDLLMPIWAFTIIGIIFIFGFGGIRLYFVIQNLIELFVAPKIWLIEYAAELVKRG